MQKIVKNHPLDTTCGNMEGIPNHHNADTNAPREIKLLKGVVFPTDLTYMKGCQRTNIW